MNFKYLFIFLALGIGLLSSCTKENLEKNTIEEEEVIPEMVICSLALDLVETAAGLAANVSDGTAPYAYNWSTGETTAMIAVLASGTYEVTVTDSQGCQVSNIINVNIPDLCQTLIAQINETTLGSLAVTVFGGTPPYNYVWSTGATGADISVLNSGTYEVTVVDSQGCIYTTSITVIIVDCQTLTIDFYYDSAGMSLTFSAVGGTPPYIFSWLSGETTSTISVTSGTTYTAELMDANGCTTVSSFTVP